MGYASGQEPLFSQVFNNLQALNPAYAGSTGIYNGGLIYRNQWPDMGNAYITYAAYYNQPVEFIHGGAGVYVVNDRQADGLFNRLQASIIYSYQVQFRNDLTFNAGLEATLIRRSISPSSLLLPDMISGSGTIPSSEVLAAGSRSFPDFSAGVVGSYHSMYFGFSIHHLLAPAEVQTAANTLLLYRKYSFLAGTNIEITSHSPSIPGITISPAIMADIQPQASNIYYGSYLLRNPVFFGLWIRHSLPEISNTIISLQAGYNFNFLRLTYSYDVFTRMSSGIPRSGIHELSLSFRSPYEAKRKKIRAIKCPKI